MFVPSPMFLFSDVGSARLHDGAAAAALGWVVGGSGPCSRHRRCGIRPPCRPACTPPCSRAQPGPSGAGKAEI